jgi:hypothetical protein
MFQKLTLIPAEIGKSLELPLISEIKEHSGNSLYGFEIVGCHCK